MRAMEQGRPRVPGSVMFSQGRPILLATLGVPFDEEAVPVALDPAVEAGNPLIVASITELEPLALSGVGAAPAGGPIRRARRDRTLVRLVLATPSLAAPRAGSLAASMGAPAPMSVKRSTRPVTPR